LCSQRTTDICVPPALQVARWAQSPTEAAHSSGDSHGHVQDATYSSGTTMNRPRQTSPTLQALDSATGEFSPTLHARRGIPETLSTLAESPGDCLLTCFTYPLFRYDHEPRRTDATHSSVASHRDHLEHGHFHPLFRHDHEPRRALPTLRVRRHHSVELAGV
jgi:hypothetical protein